MFTLIWDLGGFDINQKDDGSKSAIEYIVSSVCVQSVELGIDPNNPYKRQEKEDNSMVMLRTVLAMGANPTLARGCIDSNLSAIQQAMESIEQGGENNSVDENIQTTYHVRKAVQGYIIDAERVYTNTRLKYNATSSGVDGVYKEPHAVPNLTAFCVHSLYRREQETGTPYMTEAEEKVFPDMLKRVALAPGQRMIQSIIADGSRDSKNTLVTQEELITLARRQELAEKAGKNWRDYTQQQANKAGLTSLSI